MVIISLKGNMTTKLTYININLI